MNGIERIMESDGMELSAYVDTDVNINNIFEIDTYIIDRYMSLYEDEGDLNYELRINFSKLIAEVPNHVRKMWEELNGRFDAIELLCMMDEDKMGDWYLIADTAMGSGNELELRKKILDMYQDCFEHINSYFID